VAIRSACHVSPQKSTASIVAMLDSRFITKVPTTNQSHEVGYDETNRVVYALGGGLVAFTIAFYALHRFQSTTGAQPLRTRWLSSTGSGMRSSNHTLYRDRRGDGDY
jgi:hypothetical protein